MKFWHRSVENKSVSHGDGELIYCHIARFATEVGVPPDDILTTSHGRRTIDTISLFDKSKANWNCDLPTVALLIRFLLIPGQSKSTDVGSIEERIPVDFAADAAEVPGSRDLLTALETNGAKWAIVTSATRLLVKRWIKMLALPCPEHLVTAEDVQVGKPHPEGYLLGKRLLEMDSQAVVLVLEDSPAGIKAGKAAGCKVLAVNTSHPVESLKQAGADWIVGNMSSVGVKVVSNGRVQLEFKDAFIQNS